MVKSLQALTDELPTDIKKLEQTKKLLQIQQSNPTATKYTISTGCQTESRSKSKALCTEKVMEMKKKMNEDYGTSLLFATGNMD